MIRQFSFELVIRGDTNLQLVGGNPPSPPGFRCIMSQNRARSFSWPAMLWRRTAGAIPDLQRLPSNHAWESSHPFESYFSQCVKV